jgi:hypothetical protein
MLSKPSQGRHFEKDRSGLQNVPVHWRDETISPPSLGAPMTKSAAQECVGNSAKLVGCSGRVNDARRVACHHT